MEALKIGDQVVWRFRDVQGCTHRVPAEVVGQYGSRVALKVRGPRPFRPRRAYCPRGHVETLDEERSRIERGEQWAKAIEA